MTSIDVHFSRSSLSGATFVVVAVGTEVYGATNVDPDEALHAVAWKASEDLATRGRRVDPKVIVERGHAAWNARARQSSSRR
jgi:hypothetical protein